MCTVKTCHEQNLCSEGLSTTTLSTFSSTTLEAKWGVSDEVGVSACLMKGIDLLGLLLFFD